VYNPVSMAQGLERLFYEDPVFSENDLFEHAGLWQSWLHHGDFSKPERAEALAFINAAFQASSAHLRDTKKLLLTLGTAEVFKLKESRQVVANNHKVPAAAFSQSRLSVEAVVDTLAPILEKLKNRQPDLEVILTVSPVRHLRNGLVENQRSKAVLLLACEQLCQELPFVRYFPAYELLMDDLRDYRFYATDLVHPSEMAVDYVWEHFSNAFFDDKTKALNQTVAAIVTASRHKPFHGETAAHRDFQQRQLALIATLEKLHPNLDFHAEKAIFKQS
jgi:GSCFA family